MSNEKPLDVPVFAETTDACSSLQGVVAIRRFQVNDGVRIIAEGQQEYVVLVHRDHEPCCQIQRNDGLQRREWMISKELQLIAEAPGRTSRNNKHTSSGLPRTRVS